MSDLHILVVDNYPIVRYGLRTLLEANPGWRCSEAATGRAALQKARRWKPEVTLLDLCLPDMPGIELIPKIREIHPSGGVLALAVHESAAFVNQVFTAGARGMVFKSDGLRELIRGVAAVARGKSFHSRRVGELIKDQSAPSAPSGAPHTPLTSREFQILKRLAEGKTNRAVAAALKISVRTVEAHRASLMRKLGLGSLSDLIYFAIRNVIVRI